MKQERTLEQVEEDAQHRAYGKCEKCGKWLEFNDRFIDIAKGSCGTSQGHPMPYMEKSVRYHKSCFQWI